MDENKNVLELHKEPVPYIAHEAAMARAERREKRDWILEIILVVLLVLSNAWWVWRDSQFETVVSNSESVEAHADGGGNAYGSLVSGDNSEVYYGFSEDNQNHD